MHTIATHVFQFTSPAPPAQVWGTITRPELTPRYLFGMTLDSSWQPGAPIVLRMPDGLLDGGTLQGEVLAADEPHRLSYTLGAGETQPITFVTWEIVAADRQESDVTLYVDETQAASDRDEEAVVLWGRITAALQTVLATLPLG